MPQQLFTEPAADKKHIARQKAGQIANLFGGDPSAIESEILRKIKYGDKLSTALHSVVKRRFELWTQRYF